MKTRFKTFESKKNNNFKNLWILWFFVLLYIALKHYIPYWNYIVYPINLLVTFLHEFWHAFFALITGWSVHWLVVNSNWSWVTTTSGWIRDLVAAWWYLGSAIFGNILLYIWFKSASPSSSFERRGTNLSQIIIYFLSALMVFVAIFWFNWIISSLLILALAWGLFTLAKYSKYDSLILQFLGVSSIIYIIEDFNVWPSSDLAKFSWILPQTLWMYVWLIIVIIITWWNLRLIFKK